jgi:hypothetical protein
MSNAQMIAKKPSGARRLWPVARLRAGDAVAPLELASADGGCISIPDDERLTHLQFRRFSGCAFCNMHLRSFEVRHAEISAAGVREVVVFRSRAEDLMRAPGDLPYATVLDPTGALYDAFCVGAGFGAVLHPRALVAALPNLLRTVFERRLGAPPNDARKEALLGFPADFLIGTNGIVLACRYGAHAADGWSVDELLTYARAAW